MKALLFLLVVWTQNLDAATFKDATGVEVQVPENPKRIVTLAPSLAELTSEFYPTELSRIVGVTEYTTFPKEISTRESVGPYYRFNVEKVSALKPDLVLATMDGNPSDGVTRLRGLGLSVFVISTQTLKEVASSMRLLGHVFGKVSEGESLAQKFESGIGSFRERAKGRPRYRVFAQISDQPIVTIGNKSFLHEVLETIGAKNLYSDLGTGYPRPSLEDVVKRGPEVILLLSMGDDEKAMAAMESRWKKFKTLPAVKNQKVKIVKSDLLVKPTLRLLDGMKELEAAVYAPK